MPHLCDTHAEGAAARLRKGGKQYPFFKDDIWDESNKRYQNVVKPKRKPMKVNAAEYILGAKYNKNCANATNKVTFTIVS